VAQERERYRITENKYSEGLATNLDLSTAETSLIEAELQLQQNYIRWYQYHLQLDFATGGIGQ
jgi:outer membrane protein TolC